MRIAVLGSANMDVVVTVARLPRPGETVTGAAVRLVPGGKGANQALAAARAGGTVTFLGAVGADAHGATIRRLLADAGVDVAGLAVADAPTGTAHILVDAGGANQIVVVPGANGTITALTDAHRDGIRGADVLLLQLELPLPVVTAAAGFARSVGVRTVLTPAPAVPLPSSLLAAVDLLVPNEHEVRAVTGLDDPIAAAGMLAGSGPDVLVTLGPAGARYLRAGRDAISVPAFDVAAVDTTAAGDVFVGAFVTRPRADDPSAALRFATAAAALTVQRVGASTSMPTRAEILAFLDGVRRAG